MKHYIRNSTTARSRLKRIDHFCDAMITLMYTFHKVCVKFRPVSILGTASVIIINRACPSMHALQNATYSSSAVLCTTTVCRRADQATGPPSTSNTIPVTLFRVFGQYYQSKSQYPSRLISFILDVFPFACFLKKMLC